MDSTWTWGHPYVKFCENRTVPDACGCRTGFGYPYDQLCVQGFMGSGEARECTLGLYLPAQTRYLTRTTNWPSVGTKSPVAHV